MIEEKNREKHWDYLCPTKTFIQSVRQEKRSTIFLIPALIAPLLEE
jgi:hypothetical protein